MMCQLPLEITREDHIWMARSTAIQGFLVTGETLDQLFTELPGVAQALYEACQENGWRFVESAPDARPDDIVWLIELPHPILQAA